MKQKLIILLMILLLTSFVSAAPISFTGDTPVEDSTSSTFIVNTTIGESSDSFSFVNIDNDVSLWLTGESNAGVPVDNSGYNYTFTQYNGGAVTTSEGRFDDALNFSDTTNNRFLITNTSDDFDRLLPGTGSYTWSAWIKSSDDVSQDFMDTASIDSSRMLMRLKTGGNLQVYMYSNVLCSVTYAGSDLYNGEWNHMVVVLDRDDDYLKLYVNGVKNYYNLDMSPCQDFSDAFTSIMFSTLTNHFNGSIDEWMMFKRALNQNEILSLYNASSHGLNNDYTDTAQTLGEIEFTATNIENDTSYDSVSRNFTFSNVITTLISPLENTMVVDELVVNVSSVENASCYAVFEGETLPMTNDSSGYFTATKDISLLDDGNYNVFINCSVDNLFETENITFIKSDHLIYYVDKENSVCSDYYTALQSTNINTPFCTISKGLQSVASPGDEVKILDGIYNTTGIHSVYIPIHGTAEKPIIISGESNTVRTILDGSNHTDNMIAADYRDYVTYRYFNLTQAYNDGMNVHGDTDIAGYNVKGIVFENITAYKNGRNGEGVYVNAAGDGVSFHEYTSGVGRHLDLIQNYKAGITDIGGTRTNYSDLYVEGAQDLGIWLIMLTASYGHDYAYHYLENVVVENSPSCLFADVTTDFVNLRCTNNGLGLFKNNSQIEIAYKPTTVDGLVIENTPVSQDAVYVHTNGTFEAINGVIDGNITVDTGGNVSFINVSTGPITVIDGELTKQWIYEILPVNEYGYPVDAVITITDNSSIEQIKVGDVYYLTELENVDGTETTYTYTIEAEYDGEIIEQEITSITDNRVVTILFDNSLIETTGGIINVKETSYIAFGLIAVMLLASIAMGFIVMIKDGADTGTLMTLGILAIGVSVILIVGFIIMNSVAIGIIAGI